MTRPSMAFHLVLDHEPFHTQLFFLKFDMLLVRKESYENLVYSIKFSTKKSTDMLLMRIA